jgi:hypothetical protein
MFIEHLWFLLQIIGQMSAPAVILTLGGLGTALVFRIRGQDAPSPLRMLWGLGGPLILILWASVTYELGQGSAARIWPMRVHLGLAILSLGLVLGVGWSLPRGSRRWLYVPVALGLIGLIVAAAFVGSMAISGDWI